MPRSGQVYRLISNDYSKFEKVIMDIQDTETEEYPFRSEIEKINTDIFSVHIIVEYIDGTARMQECVFVQFNFKKHLCHIIGRREGRDKTVRLLNDKIDVENPTIQPFKLDGRSIFIDMLRILNKIDQDHFIKTLKADFGISGIKSQLDKHRIQKIQYGFVQNVCASKHEYAKDYVKHSTKCTIMFAVWEVGEFIKPKMKNNRKSLPASLEVSSNYSFRFFWDYDHTEILSTMTTLDIDPDAYSE